MTETFSQPRLFNAEHPRLARVNEVIFIYNILYKQLQSKLMTSNRRRVLVDECRKKGWEGTFSQR